MNRRSVRHPGSPETPGLTLTAARP